MFNYLYRTVTALAVVALSCLTLPLNASATKKGPPLPIQITVDNVMPKVGAPVNYTVTVPNNTSSGYWGVDASVNFPPSLSCTHIVSAASNCALNGNRLSCHWDDFRDWQVASVTVQCIVTEQVCPTQIRASADLAVNKPAQSNWSAVVINSMCLPTPIPTSTPTFVPTSTPLPTYTPTAVPTYTFTPLPTYTATPLPTFTYTAVPTYTPTPLPTSTPIIIPTATQTATPTATYTSTPYRTECNDHIDNDNDGKKDFPHDPDCDSPQDQTECQTLRITKSVHPSVTGGSHVDYRYTVRNEGSSSLTSVTVKAVFTNRVTGQVIAPVFQYVRSDGSVYGCSVVQAENAVVCSIPHLSAGSEVAFTLTYYVPPTCADCNSIVASRTEVSTNGTSASATAETLFVCNASVTPAPTHTPGYYPTPKASDDHGQAGGSSCTQYSVLRRINGGYRGVPVTIREQYSLLQSGEALPCVASLMNSTAPECLKYDTLSGSTYNGVAAELAGLSASGQCFGMSKLTSSLLGQACDIDEDSFECEQFLALNTLRSNAMPIPDAEAGVSLGREHNSRFQVIVFDSNCKLVVDPSPEDEDNSCPAGTITGTLYSTGRRGSNK